jgi:adenylate cyclase
MSRSLKAIPIFLYNHAQSIITLNLSRNPMVEIPLDFIQACTTLRELRLSNMAMKKVPHSVRYCQPLYRLDLTSNRIGDLSEAGLDRLPGLSHLKLQNNRMAKLPDYFQSMRSLTVLNISNNKFAHLPRVVCKITGLLDLDISFNAIRELPRELGRLINLQRLIIVGNVISSFPEECAALGQLAVLDCRRNAIADLSLVSVLPNLTELRADYNAVHALELRLGPKLGMLEATRNDITQLTLSPDTSGPFALTTMDLSHAKLSTLDENALSQLTSLTSLKLDHNSFRAIPDTFGNLTKLTHFSCSNNQLDALPSTIGQLQKLETLDVNSNSITELPASLWNCASLIVLNATSNLLTTWQDPPQLVPSSSVSTPPPYTVSNGTIDDSIYADRKPSTAGSIASQRDRGRPLPPLAHSLEKLFLGENLLTDDVLMLLTLTKELKVLNLSFNQIQEIPHNFFRNITKLEELYLSGNKLSALPTEHLPMLGRLKTLFLNGNKLQSLPQELAQLTALEILDVGSNVLRYNVMNYEFDWNW